jgi:uncharacterized membrane protein YeaQ/YmgE (transglycosylase-associated protein family)
MSAMEWFGWLIIGGIAGWLASMLTQMKKRSLWTDVIVGIIGALIGGILFYEGLPGANVANIWSLFVALVGSVLLLGLFRLLRFSIGNRLTQQ